MTQVIQAGGGRPGKLAQAEERIGKPLSDYLHAAVKRGLTQKDMARECGVSRAWICHRLRKLGYGAEVTIRYKRRGD